MSQNPSEHTTDKEAASRLKTLKSVYIMTETGCLKPFSGAFMHITTGIRELGSHADLQVVTNLGSLPYLQQGNFVVKEQKPSGVKAPASRFSTNNRWWGVIRDLRRFFQQIKELPRMYREIKITNPDFIYERAAYLNFNGLIISKLLRLPLFYEVNGVLAQDLNNQYLSLIRPLCLSLERWAYHQAKLCFCVGGTGVQLKLKSEDFVSVQNGIEQSFLEKFRNHAKVLSPGEKLQACFIGQLMQHHNLNILFESWQQSTTRDRWHFHFVGGGKYEDVLADAPTGFSYEFHGIIPHHQLGPVLEKCHIGLIPHSQPEASYMKLYTYGAGKLCCLVPGWDNFRSAFSDQELKFFEPGSAMSLAAAMDQAAANLEESFSQGERLYARVESDYTWQKIFNYTIQKIHEYLALPTHT